MHPRKSKEIQSVLLKKGFKLEPKHKHHEFYYFVVNGKISSVYTYFSHSKKDYDNFLLSQIKKQLLFDNTSEFEDFLNCPFTETDYLEMLKRKNVINI